MSGQPAGSTVAAPARRDPRRYFDSDARRNAEA
jgi:hypothetical protein